MFNLPGFVDMAHTPEELEEEKREYASPLSSHAMPIYPYGLCISLGNDELEKLNLDGSCEAGDMLYMDCIAKVTSCSSTDTTEGVKRRIELQITHIAIESPEEEEAEGHALPQRKIDYGKFYKS